MLNFAVLYVNDRQKNVSEANILRSSGGHNNMMKKYWFFKIRREVKNCLKEP